MAKRKARPVVINMEPRKDSQPEIWYRTAYARFPIKKPDRKPNKPKLIVNHLVRFRQDIKLIVNIARATRVIMK